MIHFRLCLDTCNIFVWNGGDIEAVDAKVWSLEDICKYGCMHEYMYACTHIVLSLSLFFFSLYAHIYIPLCVCVPSVCVLVVLEVKR